MKNAFAKSSSAISPAAFIARHKPRTFNVNYATDYKSFILRHIASDASHPLHTAQKRRQAERCKEGLWWHVTTGLDLSKSSCVRSWARRRLRNALCHELRQRGYDKSGCLVNVAAIKDRPDLLEVLQRGRSLRLEGSLRLHVQAPLVAAKYADVCAETGQLIEDMLQALKSSTGKPASQKNISSYPKNKK